MASVSDIVELYVAHDDLDQLTADLAEPITNQQEVDEILHNTGSVENTDNAVVSPEVITLPPSESGWSDATTDSEDIMVIDEWLQSDMVEVSAEVSNYDGRISPLTTSNAENPEKRAVKAFTNIYVPTNNM